MSECECVHACNTIFGIWLGHQLFILSALLAAITSIVAIVGGDGSGGGGYGAYKQYQVHDKKSSRKGEKKPYWCGTRTSETSEPDFSFILSFLSAVHISLCVCCSFGGPCILFFPSSIRLFDPFSHPPNALSYSFRFPSHCIASLNIHQA